MTDKPDQWSERFSHLWPTQIVERHLPGAIQHNPVIASIIHALDSNADNMTTDYQGAGFLNRPEPSIAWLRSEIADTVFGYLNHCGIKYPVKWDVQGWANVNRLGDYHAPHNHGWSYLSGTYYVHQPLTTGSDADRAQDMSPASITFSDPRYGAYRHSLAENPNDQARQTFHPPSGTLLMWPAPLVHYVHPNHSDDPRVSVSFNVILEWSNDYAA